MAFVYERRGVRYWWICWTDADGIEQRCSSKTTDRDKAIALANELERQVLSPMLFHRPSVRVFHRS